LLKVQKYLAMQAAISEAKQDFTQALKLCQQQQKICESNGYAQELSNCLRNQWEIYFITQDAEANQLYLNHKEIFAESWSKAELCSFLELNGMLSYLKKNLDESVGYSMEELKLSKEIGGKEKEKKALTLLFYILGKKRDIKGLLDLYKANSDAFNETSIISELEGFFDRVALYYYGVGNYPSALEYFNAEEDIARRRGEKERLQSILGLKGDIHQDRRELQLAAEAYAEQQEICKQTNKKEWQNAAAKRFKVYFKTKESQKAFTIFKENKQALIDALPTVDLIQHLGNLGLINYYDGNLALALEIYKEQEVIIRSKTDDKFLLERCIADQGLVHEANGRFNEALCLYKNQEQICIQAQNNEDQAWSLSNQGDVYHKKGALANALDAYKKQEKCGNKELSNYWQNVALINQAEVYNDQSDFEIALRLCEQQEKKCKETNETSRLHSCLCGEAEIYLKKGETEKALQKYGEAAEVCRSRDDLDGLQRCLGYEAQILESSGEASKATLLRAERAKSCLSFDAKKWLQVTLGNQDAVHSYRKELEGDLESAELQKQIQNATDNINNLLKTNYATPVFLAPQDLAMQVTTNKAKTEVCQNSNFKMGIQYTYGNQGILSTLQNQPDAALSFFKLQEQVCREIGYKEGLQISLGRQANIFRRKNDFEQALKLYNEQMQICLELGCKDALQACMGHKANILLSKGELEKAFDLFKQQEAICLQIGNQQGLQKALGGKALVEVDRRKHVEAFDLLSSQQQLCHAINNVLSLTLSMLNEVKLLIELDRREESFKLMQQVKLIGAKNSFAQDLT
jgi:tetratricopeptide (TPR) repeat protein